MRNLENQITKMAENRYFPYIHIYVCSFKKYANFMSFYKNIFRREIPSRKVPSFGARFLPKRVPPFGIPTKGSALRTRSSVRGTNIAILVALILVLPRALITRIYVFVKKIFNGGGLC